MAAGLLGLRVADLDGRLAPESGLAVVEGERELSVLSLAFRMVGVYEGFRVEAGFQEGGKEHPGWLTVAGEVFGLPGGFEVRRSRPGDDWWRSRSRSPWKTIGCDGPGSIRVRADSDTERDECAVLIGDHLCGFESELKWSRNIHFLLAKDRFEPRQTPQDVAETLKLLTGLVASEARTIEDVLIPTD